MGIRVSVSKVKIGRVAWLPGEKVASLEKYAERKIGTSIQDSLHSEEEEARIYQGIRDTFSEYKRPDRYRSDIKAIMEDYGINICTAEKEFSLFENQILEAVTGNEMEIYFLKKYEKADNKVIDLDFSFGDCNRRFDGVTAAHTGLKNGVSYTLFTARMTIAIMAVLLEWNKRHEGVEIEKVLQSLLFTANLTNVGQSDKFIDEVVDIAMDIAIGESAELKLHAILTDTSRHMWSTNHALKELQREYDLPGEILEVYCNKHILPELREDVEKQYSGVFEKETDKMQRAKKLSKIFQGFSSKKKSNLSAELVLDSMYVNAMLKEAEFADVGAVSEGDVALGKGGSAGVVSGVEEDDEAGVEENEAGRVKSSLSTFIEILSDDDVKKALKAPDRVSRDTRSIENATSVDRLLKGLFNTKIFSKFCKPWEFIVTRCRDYADEVKRSLPMLGTAVVFLVSISVALLFTALMLNGREIFDSVEVSAYRTASAIEKGELAMEAVTDLAWFFGAALIGILTLEAIVIMFYGIASLIILKKDNIKLKRDPKLVITIEDMSENKRNLDQRRILLLSELKSEIALRKQAKLLLSRRTKSEFIIKYLSELCNVSDSDAQLYNDELLRARNRKEYKREALLLALAEVAMVSSQTTEKQFSLEELFKRHEITLSNIDEGENSMNKNLETTLEGLKGLAKDCGEFARAHGGQALKAAEEQGIKISSGVKAGMKAGVQAYKETQGSRDPDGFGTADFGKYSDIPYGCEEKPAEAADGAGGAGASGDAGAGASEKNGTGEEYSWGECHCEECKASEIKNASDECTKM